MESTQEADERTDTQPQHQHSTAMDTSVASLKPLAKVALVICLMFECYSHAHTHQEGARQSTSIPDVTKIDVKNMVDLVAWEDDIVWDAPQEVKQSSTPDHDPRRIFTYTNPHLKTDSAWTEGIIWDIDQVGLVALFLCWFLHHLPLDHTFVQPTRTASIA